MVGVKITLTDLLEGRSQGPGQEKTAEVAAGAAASSAKRSIQPWACSKASSGPYIVCAMFTREYEHKARRLRASLDLVQVEYAIFEVPFIHRSISRSGVSDLSFSKPEFIQFAIDRFRKPVLYVDSDICFRSAPALFDRFRGEFAIYNWLASNRTDAWVPVPGQNPLSGVPPRYWQFSHAVDDWSEIQLICSGCVQWWAPTLRARALLERWRDVIRKNPFVQDDHCLDVAFNFRPPDGLRVMWLPNGYARIGFWIFDEPVIDHPDLPTSASNDFREIPGGQADATHIKIGASKIMPLPRTMLLDVRSRLLIARNIPDNGAPPVKITNRLFLPAGEDGGLSDRRFPVSR